MGKDDFLKNLKDSLDKGEFNSDAAKKINEIDSKADEMMKSKSIGVINKSVEDKIKSTGIKNIGKDQLEELNSQYEKQMNERAKEEIILATIATFENIEFEIDSKINDLIGLINDVNRDYDNDDEKCVELFKKIKELQDKYMLNN